MRTPLLASLLSLALPGAAFADVTRQGDDRTHHRTGVTQGTQVPSEPTHNEEHRGHNRPSPAPEAPAADAAALAQAADDTFKKYSQAYCGADAPTDECKKKYSEQYGAILQRWAKLCPDGQPAAADKEWLDRFSEKCDVKVSSAKAPELMTKEQWIAAGEGHPGRFEAVLLEKLEVLQAFQRGYDAATRLHGSLQSESFTKDQFEDALKRRTKKLTPDFGTKKDNEFRVVNVIYLYLGDEAKKFLIGDGVMGKNGANVSGGKLAFLERAEKVGFEALDRADKEKFLNGNDKIALDRAANADKQAKKQAEQAHRALENGMRALGEGRAPEAGGNVTMTTNGAAAPFWAGRPVSAAQIAEQQSKLRAAQLPQNFRSRGSEPPPVETAKAEDENKDGCRSFLGWRCIGRGLKKGVGKIGDGAEAVGKGIGKGAKKAGHEIKEAVMIGSPRAPKPGQKPNADGQASAGRPAADAAQGAAAPQPAPANAGANPAAAEAAALASAKQSAAAATTRADAAANAAAAAAERAKQAAAAGTGFKEQASTAAGKAEEQADLAKNAATNAKELAARAQSATASADAQAKAQEALRFAGMAESARTEAVKFETQAKAAAAATASSGGAQQGGGQQQGGGAAQAQGGAAQGGQSDRRPQSQAMRVPKAANQGSAEDGRHDYHWGLEVKRGGKIVEANWSAGAGSYLKIVSGGGMDAASDGSYVVPAGAKFEYRIGARPQSPFYDDKVHCNIADGGPVKIQRDDSGPKLTGGITTGAKRCP